MSIIMATVTNDQHSQFCPSVRMKWRMSRGNVLILGATVTDDCSVFLV